MFESIFKDGTIAAEGFFLVLLTSLLLGAAFSFLCCHRSRSSKSFGIALALLPMAVAVVIALVNGNLGIGVAIAGAFGLVRFRSAPGTAKEIAAIFIAMAAGLAFGTGYLMYGALFLMLSGAILYGYERYLQSSRSAEKREKIVKITIPEMLDYADAFDEVFEHYTASAELERVKSTNMGSMFRLTYRVMLRPGVSEKEFLDELRVRNGNLEIECHRADLQQSDL